MGNEVSAPAGHGTRSSARFAWIPALAVIALASWFTPAPLVPSAGLVEKAGQTMVSLFLVALVIERALEVFITTWRGERTSMLRERANHAEDRRADEGDARARLIAFQAETQRIALWSAFAVGVAVSAAGLRSLEPLMEGVAGLPRGQVLLLRTLDVLLTGGILAGGSDGIHKIMQAFLDFVEMTRRRLDKAPGA